MCYCRTPICVPLPDEICRPLRLPSSRQRPARSLCPLTGRRRSYSRPDVLFCAGSQPHRFCSFEIPFCCKSDRFRTSPGRQRSILREKVCSTPIGANEARLANSIWQAEPLLCLNKVREQRTHQQKRPGRNRTDLPHIATHTSASTSVVKSRKRLRQIASGRTFQRSSAMPMRAI